MSTTTSSVAKVIEISAQSPKSFQDAVDTGVARASATLRNVEGVWIKEQSLSVADGKIKAYRVVMKVTFVFEE
jgi:flavin-binding protein dodecin